MKKYLNGIEKLNEKFKSEEFLPDTLQERLSEASSLLHSLPVQLKDREQYLLDNKKYVILVAKNYVSFIRITVSTLKH